MTDWRSLRGPLLFAHRGAGREQPENSLPAFAAAIAAGADVLEADLHRTRDGHIVVAHDPTGARVAGDPREIRRITLAEVKAWDLRVAGAAATGPDPVRIPTLSEVLEAFPGTPLNLDVKQRDPDMTEALVQLLARHGAESQVLLTSFSSRITRRLRRLGYPGPTGLAQAEVATAVFLPEVLRRIVPVAGQRMQIPTHTRALRLDRAELIDKAHRLGLAVDYWVINDRREAERLLELGADGIVTDDPGAMAQLFARAASTAAWRTRHAGPARPPL